MRYLLFGLLSVTMFAAQAMAAGKPLMVYVLAGQSNMEGHARLSTFDYIGDDPATAPLLKAMRDDDGTPHVCQRVWISYYTGMPHRNMLGEATGKLTAGYGARPDPKTSTGQIGPEFTFGLAMEKAYDGPILIIKTAWGGKSLHTDFRPPSAGPYKLPKKTQELWDEHPQGAHGIPKLEDRPKWQAEKDKASGVFYRLMIDHVKKVLADPKRVCREYDPAAGYELAGFVWFQGWNDMVDRQTYPNRDQPDGYAEYSRLMSCFIRDVRKDLGAPKLPFVIGVIGVGGEKAAGGMVNLRTAMAAPASSREFTGTVAAVETAPFWDYKMAALEAKKRELDHVLSAGHLIAEDGFIEKHDPNEPGWKAIGKPTVEKRKWRYITVDPTNQKDRREPKEKRRYRIITLPNELKDWNKPGFDDSQWNSGQAPIGKGKWASRRFPQVKRHADWGDGEFVLMRSTFDVDDPDYAAYRLAVLSRQGYEIYLNGELIQRYVWWLDNPVYRGIDLNESNIKHLKKGKNVLAVYGFVEYDRKTGEPFNTIDVRLEGITKAGLAYVNSDQYRHKLADKVCTRQEARVISGMSNGGYHYLGSGKIIAQIGNAFAEAMVKLEK